MCKPLVFYASSLFIALFTTLMFYSNVFIGAVIAASFLSILFFTQDKKMFAMILTFFFIGIVDYYLFFNIYVPENIEVRLIEKKKYNYIGDFNGRKIIIKGLKSKVEEGEKLSLEGKYKNDRNLAYGIIGSFEVKNVTRENKDFLYKTYAFKKKLYEKYEKSLGEEKAATVMSLCFGDTDYLNNDQKKNFQLLGVVHAISVSGFHIALIYKMLEKIIGLRVALLASFLYMIFTGAEAATIRAFLMIFIYKGSKIVFKNYDALSSLSLSAMIILLIKPSYVSDLGFMLSYLATIGIILFYKKLLRAFYKLPKSINESLSIMLSAQCFSLPYIAFTIKSFSGGFILGNLVLLPMYSLLVILGNISALIYMMPELFNIFNYCLAICMQALDGANYVLLKVTPELSYFGYDQGVAMLVIFVSFLLFNKGYEKFKYLPILIILLLFINSYAFLPQLSCININNNQCFIINYKYDNIVICDKDARDEYMFLKLKNEYKINKIVWEEDEGYAMPLGSGYLKSIYFNHKLIGLNYIEGGQVYTMVNSTKKQDIKGKNIICIKEKQQQQDMNFSDSFLPNLYVIIFNRIINVY